MLFIGALAVAIFLVYYAYSPALAISPAGKDLIRLHIIANSNSPSDQALKLKVRDRIVAETGELFRNAQSEEEAEFLLTTHLTEVEQVADRVLEEAGAGYKARAEVGIYSFPERTYKNLTLPAGRYRALRLILGEGKGANWWCVLFPPLCFVDASIGPNVAPATSSLLQAGNGSVPAGTSTEVAVRFKLAEVWQRLANRRLSALDN
ncbi:MAG: stage sporulation protein [Bacillota bacterium]|nr:stage sporulation protein [Bacillota bacterium]MDK2924724.1 stage sporulation protein [Bacillota bacterium]MDK2960806.1 stage sporulation protein [Bacillota bacterium]